jgi:uncharacterized protein YbjT (DUF2867 family)
LKFKAKVNSICKETPSGFEKVTMGPTVLVIGASGSMGSLVMKEFINHRSSFGRVGVLTDPAKESKFAQLKEQGFDVILGSYTDPASYEGK